MPGISAHRPEYPNRHTARSVTSALFRLPRIVSNVLYVQARLPLAYFGGKRISRAQRVASLPPPVKRLRTTPTTHVPHIKLRIRLCIPRWNPSTRLTHRFTTLPGTIPRNVPLFMEIISPESMSGFFSFFRFLEFLPTWKKTDRILGGFRQWLNATLATGRRMSWGKVIARSTTWRSNENLSRVTPEVAWTAWPEEHWRKIINWFWVSLEDRVRLKGEIIVWFRSRHHQPQQAEGKKVQNWWGKTTHASIKMLGRRRRLGMCSFFVRIKFFWVSNLTLEEGWYSACSTF